MSVFIDDEKFKVVLNSTPLVSIDLLISDSNGKVLLGQRRNRPAQGYWFVPGGRILKNESLAAAFERLTVNELGRCFSISCARLKGPFDHFYGDCVFGAETSTHYVAIAYHLLVDTLVDLPAEQHSNYRWFNIAELQSDPLVHPHTKAYFLKD